MRLEIIFFTLSLIKHWKVLLLPRRLCFSHCLFACLSLSRIMQKLLDGFQWNLKRTGNGPRNYTFILGMHPDWSSQEIALLLLTLWQRALFSINNACMLMRNVTYVVIVVVVTAAGLHDGLQSDVDSKKYGLIYWIELSLETYSVLVVIWLCISSTYDSFAMDFPITSIALLWLGY